MQNQQNLLTISQLATLCSTSRSSILRMEQIGILTPAYINPESGYRYYDYQNVIHVLRNLSLQDIGITQKEMKANMNTRYTLCIPILMDSKKYQEDKNIASFPTCNTISSLLYGGSEDIEKAFIKIGKIMSATGLSVSGDARIIAIVLSYSGECIPKEYWISRVCVPVTRKEQFTF